MKNRVNRLSASIAVLSFTLMASLAGSLSARADDRVSWDPGKAASYLDGRAVWWSEWSGAARDHGTYCISCHTTLPYAIADIAVDLHSPKLGVPVLWWRSVGSIPAR